MKPVHNLIDDKIWDNFHRSVHKEMKANTSLYVRLMPRGLIIKRLFTTIRRQTQLI